ncbi:hypothetical protein H2199_003624 [Coniosporium tulheliwenetii]|uniref:Uncharacterized protein n=1 Tax=Coniosporium tulheliwenetii TaxID=3383036 RepID=A0ACC2ZC68_9PEZI|nr:hypothetical protein H2199_003624 [Cladosporium sp. JES 115]
MALPVNIGDFIKIGRDCPGEYKNLASECRTLKNTLEDLADVLKKQRLDPKKEEELLERGQGCREVLTDLEALVDKYNSLSSKSKKTWDRLNWDQQGGRDVRARLASNVAMLCAFYDSLIHSSQLRIEEALHQLAADIRGGHREASSVVSWASTEDGDEDTAWPQIIRDLEDLGITATMADENRSFILDWFIKAINEGMLQEKAPEGDDGDSLYACSTTSRDASSGTAVNSWSENPFEVPASPTNRLARKPIASSTPPAPQPSSLQTASRTQSLPQAHSYPLPQQAYRVASIPTPQKTLTGQNFPNALPSAVSEFKESNIIWTAQLIVRHWNNRDWEKAGGCLQQQIKAVEAGESIDVRGTSCQPDIRVLRHLLGICASYQGEFHKAKKLFESVQRGPYVNGQSLDDGDLAAARWLGDTCLFLNEPENAALAWAIALDGYVSMIGITREPTPRVLSELQSLDNCLKGLATLHNSFSRYNNDASTIFATTSNTAKANLVVSTLERCRQGSFPPLMSKRPAIDVQVAEGFLEQPLIAKASWPIKWDPFFSALESITLHQRFTLAQHQNYLLDLKNLPTVGIGQSKKLDYSTRKDASWLVETLRRGLESHGIEYRENINVLTCRLYQNVNGVAFSESIGIKIRKLPLRSVYGVQVIEPMHQTRSSIESIQPANSTREYARRTQVRDEFANFIKDLLADAERDVTAQQQPGQDAAAKEEAQLRTQAAGPAPMIYGHQFHVLNASPPPPTYPPATPIIHASPAPPMPSVPPPPVPMQHAQAVGHMQQPMGGYGADAKSPYSNQINYQRAHGYYGKV